MRIRTISIDGYGRFSGRNFDFQPGFQVIVGPNERGKSTIRCFIGDMLYGQKRSAYQRVFDENQSLRVPWNNPDCYGGRIIYELDDGRVIEVIRNFDRKREALQVFDRTHAREISRDFDRLRNKEIDFAAIHLGVSKEVFFGTATINHFSLENLGDQDALNQIREKLLSLADSGDESASAEAALKRLAQRIALIGQPNARTKPLPAARARLEALEREYEAARQLQEDLFAIGDRRRMMLDELTRLRFRRDELEEEIRRIDAHERARRVREADRLQEQINAATERCFALGAVREFPLDHREQVVEADRRARTLALQHARTLQELEEAKRRLASEEESLPNDSDHSPRDISEEFETKLTALRSTDEHLRDRLQEGAAAITATQQRLASAQESLAATPQFSKVTTDPVEYVSQLISSFNAATRTRDEEIALREKLRAEVSQRRAAIADREQLFRAFPDFPEQAREYELKKRVRHEQAIQKAASLQTIQNQREELAANLPGFLRLAIGCGLLCFVLLVAFFLTQTSSLLIASGVTLIAVTYFSMMFLHTRTRLLRLDEETAATQKSVENLQTEENEASSPIDEMLRNTGRATVRELEALYDQYKEAAAELVARMEVLHDQEIRAAEAEERIPRLLQRVRRDFAFLGEQIEHESEVKETAGRIVARYQEYREAKRRVTESRAALERQESEQRRLQDTRDRTRQELENLEGDLRKHFRENGFEEESDFENVGAALRAYRDAVTSFREKRGRTELLRERVQQLERQTRQEHLELEKQQQELARRLASAGATSLQQWVEKATLAEEYREKWRERKTAEERLEALLEGVDIDELRERVSREGSQGTAPLRTREQVDSDLRELEENMESLLKEEHGLHLTLTERSAAARSLNDIEEERALLERQVALLDTEREATAHAMTLIEDIARDTHARIAPGLATRASRYLSEITDAAYDELMISRDLNISVRIPQTKQFSENPEKSLSKGTVDQIYFALRLALVQGISATGESIPMLLDDPLANYDDTRLENALRLLTRIGKDSQVLLFTCREDVARVAAALEAPVLQL